MSNLIRIGVLNFTKAACRLAKLQKPAFSRSVWHMSSTTTIAQKHSAFCACSGCSRAVHTNGEKELVEFLKDEIAAEKKAHKVKSLTKDLDGFTIKTDGADMTLTKQCDDETIVINLNVNHSVDMESEPDIDPNADKPDLGELKSKPNFEVDVIRGSTTLNFNCSFLDKSQDTGDDGYSDSFGIDEVTLFEGDWSEKIYAVSGDVLDGNLYDLFMTILEEKGVSSEFVEKLSEVATSHEHASYINLLEKLSKFASSK